MRAGRAAVLALLMTSLLATALGLNLSLDRRRTEDRVLRGVNALAEAAAAQAAAMLNGLDRRCSAWRDSTRMPKGRGGCSGTRRSRRREPGCLCSMPPGR
ncbi:hypothetical protein [Teichococcus aestuarii]|uniref:hypothetical protein n=1 Tax=Teichococcus aestuarii TaxID=568898 RepID=UPI00360A6FCC